MATKLDARQSVLRSALGMIGSAVNDSVDTIFPKIDSEIAKLFEDRNVLLTDGGTLTFNGTSLTLTESLKLQINSKVAGGTPIVIDLGATSRAFSASGRMLYAVVDRIGATAVVTADATTLPAVTSANQEVFLLAKRVDTGGAVARLYFRSGFVMDNGQSTSLGSGGSSTFSDSIFRIFDNIDNTKLIAFEASGIATGTTRTITAPDADVNLGNVNSLVTLSGVASLATDLGIFTGKTIQNNRNVKQAFQDLETEVDHRKRTNLASNAEFRFWQRQTPGTLTNRQDTQFGPDRWRILTSGGATNVSVARNENTAGIYVSRYYAQFRQADATARQFGILQWLPYDDIAPYRDRTLTLSFGAYSTGGNIPNLRVGIVRWQGTVDQPPADPVSAWAATPTLVASATFLNTPVDVPIAASLATMAGVTVTVTLGDVRNLGIFIWTPAAEANGDEFFLKEMQLSESVNDYDVSFSACAKTFSEDLMDCQKYYEKTYNVEVPPATATLIGSIQFRANGTNHYEPVSYKVQKRAAPTTTAYNTNSGATGSWRDNSAGADRTVTPADIGEWGHNNDVTASVDGDRMSGHLTWESELGV